MNPLIKIEETEQELIVRIPKSPEGIKGWDRSIQVRVQAMTSAWKKAKVAA